MTRPEQRWAHAATTGAIMLASVAGALAPLPAKADPAAPKSAADCRAITDFALRGQCWDALDHATEANAQNAQEVKKRSFGLGLSVPNVAAIVIPKKEKERVEKVRNAEIRSTTLTIASVEDTPLGRVLLTSTDGAVWEQTDSESVTNRPEPGDTVQVSKGAFGGYMCQVTRWQAVRCQRDE